jgi:carboxyl-terminal processing protease
MIKNIMKIGFGTALLFITTASAFSFCANSNKKDITPDDKQIEICRQVVALVSNYNYKQVPLNDSLSNVVFDAYLKGIDGAKIYFYESEVKEFTADRNNYDEFLMEGSLSQPFSMFNKYMDRYLNRIQFIISKVDSAKFDFSNEASIIFNRENLNWFKNQVESDAYWESRLRYDLLNLKLAGSDEAKSKETLKKRYQNLVSQAEKVNSFDAFQAFMTAYTESVDPHTNYFNPSNAAAFNIDMARSLEGIGATLGIENEFVTVKAVSPGGPADKSGLVSVDDKFLAVAQGKDGEFTDIVGWRIDNAIQLIRGAKGTTVRLKVASKGQDVASPKIIELVREKIILQDQSAKKEVKEIKQNGKTYKIGIIDIPAFYMDFKAYQSGDKNYKSTTRDVKLILDSLKAEQVDAVVVDLRSNGGGSLVEAIDLTGLFIKSGPVVQVRDTRNQIDVGEDKNASITWEGPMAVMIDRFSASASEIFAGAIQDYGRGILIGTQSFGKGTVQNAIDLDQVIGSTTNKVVGKENTYGQINLTVAKFYRINGSSTQNKGVTPDINFPMVFPADKYGESAEKSALPWDEIKKSNYKPVGSVTSNIKTLTDKHEKRMKSNKEYAYMLEDIKIIDDRDEDKPVSLNETKMKVERDENDLKTLNRENDRRAARGLAPLKKGENKPKGEKPYDFMLEEGCNIVADWLSLK